MKILITLVLIIAGLSAYSWYKSQPVSLCKTSESSTPYCKYIGKINKIYINEKGLALIFLDKAFDVNSAKSFGYEANSGRAMSIDLNQGEFSKLTYETLLLAFDEESEVELHARSVFQGHMKIDRIWVSK